MDSETASSTGVLENSLDQRFRLSVYGDMESAEHAKTRILIMIDQIVSLSKILMVVHVLTLNSLNVKPTCLNLISHCIALSAGD